MNKAHASSVQGISAFFTSIRAIWLATKTEAPKYIANDGKPAVRLRLLLLSQ